MPVYRDSTVALRKSAAARIARQTRERERQAIGRARAQTREQHVIPNVGLMLAKLPTGGIAAGGTGTVTLYTDGSGVTLGTRTIVVTHPDSTGAAAPSLRKCWITWDRGVWALVGWFCPP